MTNELHPGLGSGALREALEKLSNEASGMLGLSGVREAIGNTNMACLQLRVDEARALLSLSSPIDPAPVTLADYCERCKAGQRREYRTVVMPEPYGGTGWWHWSPNAVSANSSEKGGWFTCQVQSAPPQASSGIREEQTFEQWWESVNKFATDSDRLDHTIWVLGRPFMARKEAAELAWNAALAPSRQGAGT